ncbi:TlyA family RNA methyltransferase [Helicobacter sp. 11S02596-1]|uniref:23S rRNA (cytidine-2'-O)-methyltransferase TlyA n=1 Tax=Helicobacter sp. 11S02596-1 TaxID=1476194 RepID=UPI000BA7C2A9|nr:TlyA family RNA methyltransferase [Helicobacter sp. 11S02596-1]PAF44250.1 TlyA family rRNA (cytidine-2'-O)-methyltransferase [Helicobacter sp. 11S02596-1]
MRLDYYLVKNGYCKSREKAKSLITQGKISVNGTRIFKPSFEVGTSDGLDLESNACNITIARDSSTLLVSRAGAKLLDYMQKNGIDCALKRVLDVGSSTGGFAQVLLERGAMEVTCVDVGSNQLDKQLRENPKIRLFEQCDIRKFSSPVRFDLLVCDVSFISLSKILDVLIPLSDTYILLFKPQFEVGRGVKRNKKGVIQDKVAIQERLEAFCLELESRGLVILNIQKSILKGKEGNEEFFFHIKKS